MTPTLGPKSPKTKTVGTASMLYRYIQVEIRRFQEAVAIPSRLFYRVHVN